MLVFNSKVLNALMLLVSYEAHMQSLEVVGMLVGV